MSNFRKHLDITPAAPTAFEAMVYETRLHQRRIARGLQYQTGPRYGQQLADIRRRIAG